MVALHYQLGAIEVVGQLRKDGLQLIKGLEESSVVALIRGLQGDVEEAA